VREDTAGETPMELKEEFATGRARWRLLTFYQKFEHAVILVLGGLISIVVALAVWNLVLKVVASIVLSGRLRSHRLFGLSDNFRDDLYDHHCTRVQALTTCRRGATATASSRCALSS